MTEEEFWLCIDKASVEENVYNELKATLCSLRLDEIISFHQIFLHKLSEAYTFPLLAANFVISSYVSDDGFKYFRAWLLSNGSLKFFNALKNPETISDWLDKNEVDGIEGEEVLSIAEDVYADLGGDIEVFYNALVYPSDRELDMEWPEDKDKFYQKYPRLVEKFWDQQRIESLHSDEGT